MSGFEGVAAVFGIAETSFRSCIKLYEFVAALRNVPKELEKLRREIRTLFECLRPLNKRLTVIDSDDRASVRETGLGQAIEACSQACADLQADLSRWAPYEKTTFRTRLVVQLNRKKIDNATSEIVAAKQAVILAAVTVNL